MYYEVRNFTYISDCCPPDGRRLLSTQQMKSKHASLHYHYRTLGRSLFPRLPVHRDRTSSDDNPDCSINILAEISYVSSCRFNVFTFERIKVLITKFYRCCQLLLYSYIIMFF